MPIYEYACAACGHEFEEWQKMSDPPVKTCPKCKKKKVERLISQTAFQLKGGGWYADLYSSSKPGKDKSGDGGGAAKDAGSSASGAASGGSDAGKSESSGAKDKSDKSEKKDKKDSKEAKSSAKKSETRAA
jgi:putative FmdB family regulatory protein